MRRGRDLHPRMAVLQTAVLTASPPRQPSEYTKIASYFIAFICYNRIVMKISVVIPAFNEEKLLPRLLTSLKNQEYSGDFEIVMADNNSTDKTAEIARSFGVKVFKEPKQGYAYACNRAFFSGTGDILARADADHVVPTTWLQTIHDAFASDPILIATGGPLYPYKNNFLENVFAYPAMIIWMLFLKVIHHGFLFPNMAVRTEAFKKLNGFDTTIKYGEDTDLCLRLVKLGKVTYNTRMYAYSSTRRMDQMGLWKFVFGYAFGNEIVKTAKKGNAVGMEVIRDDVPSEKQPSFPPSVYLSVLPTVLTIILLLLLLPHFVK